MKRTLKLAFALLAGFTAFSLHTQVAYDDAGEPITELAVGGLLHADQTVDPCVRSMSAAWEGETYRVQLQNTCSHAIRVHWCVRAKDDRLQCGINPALPPNHVTAAHAADAKKPAELLVEACSVGERCRVRR